MTQLIRQYSAINNSICIKENYLLNGLLHNDNAPASIYYHDANNRLAVSYKVFYQHGKKHNTNGPAILSYDINGYITKKQYFFMGKQLNENDLADAGYFKTNDKDTKAFIMSML